MKHRIRESEADYHLYNITKKTIQNNEMKQENKINFKED